MKKSSLCSTMGMSCSYRLLCKVSCGTIINHKNNMTCCNMIPFATLRTQKRWVNTRWLLGPQQIKDCNRTTQNCFSHFLLLVVPTFLLFYQTRIWLWLILKWIDVVVFDDGDILWLWRHFHKAGWYRRSYEQNDEIFFSSGCWREKSEISLLDRGYRSVVVELEGEWKKLFVDGRDETLVLSEDKESSLEQDKRGVKEWNELWFRVPLEHRPVPCLSDRWRRISLASGTAVIRLNALTPCYSFHCTLPFID